MFVTNISVCCDAGEKDKSANNDQWPIGTTIIVGDSILNGIVEESSCEQGRLVKVKCFPGSTVDDLGHHIIPIIREKLTNMIIHIGTNNAHSSTPREIHDNLFNRDMRLFEMLVFIIRIIWILSNI